MSLYSGLYPQITYRDGKRRFWNPVYKKTLLPLPEELVRHRFLEFVVTRKNWPLSRISMETGVEVQNGFGRTDMICYDKAFNPLLLVECKAPKIEINEKVAHQAIQYNQKVNARFVCLTNGMQTVFFDANNSDTTVTVDQVLGDKSIEPLRDLDYWQKRGFAGAKNTEWKNWVMDACNHFFVKHAEDVIYLRPPVIYEYGLNHFYHLISETKNIDLAWTIMAAPDKSTNIVILKSKNGELSSAAIIKLDAITTSENETTIISPDGARLVSANDDIAITAEKFHNYELHRTIKLISKHL